MSSQLVLPIKLVYLILDCCSRYIAGCGTSITCAPMTFNFTSMSFSKANPFSTLSRLRFRKALADIAEFLVLVVDILHGIGIVHDTMRVTAGAQAHELGDDLEGFLE